MTPRVKAVLIGLGTGLAAIASAFIIDAGGALLGCRPSSHDSTGARF